MKFAPVPQYRGRRWERFRFESTVCSAGRGTLIKLDIINEVVNKTGITKTKAEMAVETVFESMKRALSHGERIELRGFGIFNVRPRKTGIGRNPRTGAEVAIPPGKAVRFKPGKELQSLQ
jgi:DNA-binding protein HU-beta